MRVDIIKNNKGKNNNEHVQWTHELDCIPTIGSSITIMENKDYIDYRVVGVNYLIAESKNARVRIWVEKLC